LRPESPLREVRVGPPPPEPREPRSHRRFWLVLGAVALALAVLAGVLFFVAGRDDPGLSASDRGPGRVYPDQGHDHLALGEEPHVRFNSDPPTSGPHIPDPVLRDGVRLTEDQVLQALERGNVVVFFDTGRQGRALRRLQRRLTGPFEPAVAAAGQALVLARRPHTKGVIAAAWRHLLTVRTPADPRLEAFVQYWIGRGATEP
jgi:Protein of unknown function (DUF3105)